MTIGREPCGTYNGLPSLGPVAVCIVAYHLVPYLHSGHCSNATITSGTPARQARNPERSASQAFCLGPTKLNPNYRRSSPGAPGGGRAGGGAARGGGRGAPGE